jgi:hypothetical protein
MEKGSIDSFVQVVIALEVADAEEKLVNSSSEVDFQLPWLEPDTSRCRSIAVGKSLAVG